MSIKTIIPGTIEGQKETELVIDSYKEGINFLKNSGFEFKSYRETKREKWMLDNVEILIDSWPYLHPIVEIEGCDEVSVKGVSEELGFNYSDAKFEGIDYFYNKEYGIDKFFINNKIPLITFKDPNPFGKEIIC